MKRTTIYIIGFIICLSGCKKENTNYTISGILLDGTTMKPPVGKHHINLEWYQTLGQRGASGWGPAYLDSNGHFSITYPGQGGGYLFMSLDIDIPGYWLYDDYRLNSNPVYSSTTIMIPENQNINRTWTASYYGWIYIDLQPLTPFLGGDTLYVWYTRTINGLAVTQKNTFTKTFSGILDSLYLPLAGDGGGT